MNNKKATLRAVHGSYSKTTVGISTPRHGAAKYLLTLWYVRSTKQPTAAGSLVLL